MERESEVLNNPVPFANDLDFPGDLVFGLFCVLLVYVPFFLARDGFPSHDIDGLRIALTLGGFLDFFGRYDLDGAGRKRRPIPESFGVFIDEDRRSHGVAHEESHLAQLSRKIPGQGADEPPLGRDEKHDQASEK
jgi:hypothetical protein